MPADGTRAISTALADGKKSGKKYKIVFCDPSAVGTSAIAAGNTTAGAAGEMGADAEATAEAEAAAGAEAAAEAVRIERELYGNGEVTLKYSTYTEQFLIADGGLLSAEVPRA